MQEVEDFNKLVEELKTGSPSSTQLEIDLKDKIRELNRKCTLGVERQNDILKNQQFLGNLFDLIAGTKEDSSIPQDAFYKLLANTIVRNPEGQRVLWSSEFKSPVLENLRADDSILSNVCWMIVHNTVLCSPEILNQLQILKTGLDCLKSNMASDDSIGDFLGYFMDLMVCDSDIIVEHYQALEEDYQITLLYYILDYVKTESNEANINEPLLKHLCSEFKKSSDCILKTVTSYVESVKPEKVVTLLEIISSACNREKYLAILKKDASLFLNTCLVLQNFHKVGKNSSDNVFAPIQKLDSLAPASTDNSDHEKEFSYNFKTMLLKIIANLCHQNKKNQDLAREMEIMLTIFDCTNADARNPLIKEWSILAIRNLCENNLENQEMIKSLTKVGEAENPLLKEFGIDSGIMRIAK